MKIYFIFSNSAGPDYVTFHMFLHYLPICLSLLSKMKNVNLKSVNAFCHAEFHIKLCDQNLSQNKNKIYTVFLSSSNYV